jgi:glycosyltransferase involved in cell wall biosynthesis
MTASAPAAAYSGFAPSIMKKKLGVITTSLETSYGGVGPFIRNLDPFLRDAYQVTYINLPGRFHRVPVLPGRLVFLIYLIFNRRTLLDQDILLSHEPEGGYVATFTKTPLVHIFHGNHNAMSQSRYWYGKYFKGIFDAFDRRIIKTAVRKYTVGKERDGIPKILNPIHHRVSVKDNKTRSGFIFAGRLELIKNIDKLITVYARLSSEIKMENKLYIAGRGTQEKALRKLAESLGETQNVEFLGSLDNASLLEIASTKRILVMASSQEGLPMAIAEALSLGVPVIATDTGDISRVLKSDFNGFLLPVDFDHQNYVNAINAVLADYSRFAANALISAEVFRAESVAKGLISDINALC